MAWYQSGLVKGRVPLNCDGVSRPGSSSSSLEPRDLMGPEATFDHFGDEATASIQDLGFGSRAYIVTPAPEAYAEQTAQYMSFTLGSGSSLYPDDVCDGEEISGAADLLAALELSPVPAMASSSVSTDWAESDGSGLSFVVADDCISHADLSSSSLQLDASHTDLAIDGIPADQCRYQLRQLKRV